MNRCCKQGSGDLMVRVSTREQDLEAALELREQDSHRYKRFTKVLQAELDEARGKLIKAGLKISQRGARMKRLLEIIKGIEAGKGINVTDMTDILSWFDKNGEPL